MAKTTAPKRALSKPAKKGEPVYNRIVLKLSGESFQGPRALGLTARPFRPSRAS